MIIISVNTAKAETIKWETIRYKIISNSYDVQLSRVDIDICKAKILGSTEFMNITSIIKVYPSKIIKQYI